jgi:hypothetical protein
MLYELEPHPAEHLSRPFIARVDVGEVSLWPVLLNQRLDGPPTVTPTLMGLEYVDANFVLFRQVTRPHNQIEAIPVLPMIDLNKAPIRIGL